MPKNQIIGTNIILDVFQYLRRNNMEKNIASKTGLALEKYKCQQKYFTVICLSLFMGGTIWAQHENHIDVNVKKSAEFYEATFIPLNQHHFNLKAPNKIQEMTKGTTKNLLANTESAANIDQKGITIRTSNAQDCELNFKIYVCDNANTYCIPKEGQYLCAQNKLSFLSPKSNTESAITASASTSSAASSSAPNSALSTSSNSALFILNNPTLALEKAKVENKPLLIDFFGTWCPPCNVLDETVFNHPKFKSYQNKMIFLKLDADLPISWNLKSQYAIRGYPTVIFATNFNEEIYRVIGSMNPNSFFKKMDYAIKNKNQSIADLLKSFQNQRTPENAWKLIDAYNNQENYVEAYKLIPFAIKKAKLTTKEQDLLQYIPLKMTLPHLAKENKGKYIDAIKNSIESFPYEETFLDKLNILESLSDELKDENLKKWAALQTLKITNDLMVKRISEDSFISQTDIYFIRADAFEKLGSKTEAQFVYRLAAQEIEKQIKKFKLNLNTNRGFNLDRVYAIYKSGDVQTADALYKNLIQIYPEEFTFYYNHANVLKDLNKKEEALTQAKKALEYSYGDNKLRAAFFTAELQKDLKQKDAALEVLEDAINTATLPEDKTIRTHRYYKKLVDLKEQLRNTKN